MSQPAVLARACCLSRAKRGLSLRSSGVQAMDSLPVRVTRVPCMPRAHNAIHLRVFFNPLSLAPHPAHVISARSVLIRPFLSSTVKKALITQADLTEQERVPHLQHTVCALTSSQQRPKYTQEHRTSTH